MWVLLLNNDIFHAVDEVEVCNAETIDSGSRGVFHWNETEVNATTNASCFYGPPDVMVTRICLSPNNLSPAMIEICRTATTAQFAAIQNVRLGIILFICICMINSLRKNTLCTVCTRVLR